MVASGPNDGIQRTFLPAFFLVMTSIYLLESIIMGRTRHMLDVYKSSLNRSQALVVFVSIVDQRFEKHNHHHQQELDVRA